jgi:hypothetical protein
MLIDMCLNQSNHNILIYPFGNLVTNLLARAEIELITGVEDVWFVCRLDYSDEPEGSIPLSIQNSNERQRSHASDIPQNVQGLFEDIKSVFFFSIKIDRNIDIFCIIDPVSCLS